MVRYDSRDEEQALGCAAVCLFMLDFIAGFLLALLAHHFGWIA